VLSQSGNVAHGSLDIVGGDRRKKCIDRTVFGADGAPTVARPLLWVVNKIRYLVDLCRGDAGLVA